MGTPMSDFPSQPNSGGWFEALQRAEARIRDLELELIASKPLYSRRKLEEENATLKARIEELEAALETFRGLVEGWPHDDSIIASIDLKAVRAAIQGAQK